MLSALHATAKYDRWEECIGVWLDESLAASAITLLPSIIERIPVLLYVGDQDWLCNYMGIESLIKSMSWNGATGLGVSVSSVGYARIFDSLIGCAAQVMDCQRISRGNMGIIAKLDLC